MRCLRIGVDSYRYMRYTHSTPGVTPPFPFPTYYPEGTGFLHFILAQDLGQFPQDHPPDCVIQKRFLLTKVAFAIKPGPKAGGGISSCLCCCSSSLWVWLVSLPLGWPTFCPRLRNES